MNKRTILTLFLAQCLLINSGIGLCAYGKTNNIKPASNTLKGSVEDYRLEYINKDWWDKFNDPTLKEYILKAVKDNYDLKIATLKVAESRAVVQEYFGKELPSIDLNSEFFDRKKTSGTVSFGNFAFPSYKQSTYMFPLDASWEIDLWRKNRDATIGKKKELESMQYAEKAAYISLSSMVATTYFNLLSVDKQIQIQEELISLRKAIYEMMKDNNKYGLSPTTDVIDADKAFTEAQSGMNDLKKQQAILQNQLSVLTGQSVDNAASLKRARIDEIDLIKDLPQSIDSKAVLERPDILKSESDLQKSRIDVKLARKDFLPDFSILGQFGFNSNTLSKVFNWDSYITSYGLGIAHSVFAGGQKKAVLKQRKIQYQEMLENYQKTILQSFQEVNDSLASLKFDTQKDNDNIQRIKLEKDNLGIINNRYAYGAISLLDQLQYKERIYALEKDRIQSKTQCLVDSLSLYKATGGKL